MATKPERYRPAILHQFSNYRMADVAADLGSGATVAVIALPLAIGFGIASGGTPAQGLWTAVIAGFVISVFGGSRFQVGGPTGAFVPVLAGIVAAFGYEGLMLATFLAGLILALMGLFKFGALLRYVPYPVIAGFTTGIAVTIFLGQVPDLLGIHLDRPSHAPELFWAIVKSLGGTHWHSSLLGGAGLIIVFLWPKITARVPSAIVAVVTLTVGCALLGWDDVPTIRSKFGDLPSTLPGWHLPEITLDRLRTLIGPAFTIAALGAIESLLSATVADGMAGTRHHSNSELIGQGIANMISPLAGGFAATGAIARTAANIRSGARSPLSGIVHSLVLMLFVLVAAKWAGYIPLTALSAVLIGVAVRMAEWDTFREVWRSSRADFGVMLSTFVLTVVFDLTAGVVAGLVIAMVLFVRRMEQISHVKPLTPESDSEIAGPNSLRGKKVPDGVVLFRFEGPLFFAAVEKLEFALRTHGEKPRVVIFRMRLVPAIDATALHSLEVAVEKMHRDGVRVLITAIQPQPMKVLVRSGLADKIGLGNFCAHLDEALELCTNDNPVTPARA